MPNDWERLSTYPTLVEAELALARLAQAGIEGRVHSDDAGGAYPVLQNHGSHLFVRPDDAKHARAALDEPLDVEGNLESAEVLAAAEDEVSKRGGGRRLVFGASPDRVVVCILLFLLLGFLAFRADVFTSN